MVVKAQMLHYQILISNEPARGWKNRFAEKNKVHDKFHHSDHKCAQERFSISGYAMTNRREGTLPSNFESWLYLYVNRDFWGIGDVKEIVNYVNS